MDIKSVNLNTKKLWSIQTDEEKINNAHVLLQTFVYSSHFYQILAQMLEACGKSPWNLRKCFQNAKPLHVLSTSVLCETVTIICLNPLWETVSLFCYEKDEVLVNLWTWTWFSRETFYFESIWRSLFSLLTFYFTISLNFSHLLLSLSLGREMSEGTGQ